MAGCQNPIFKKHHRLIAWPRGAKAHLAAGKAKALQTVDTAKVKASEAADDGWSQRVGCPPMTTNKPKMQKTKDVGYKKWWFLRGVDF